MGAAILPGVALAPRLLRAAGDTAAGRPAVAGAGACKKDSARLSAFLSLCVFGGPNSGSGKRLPIWGPRYLSLSLGGFGKRTLFGDLRIAELARQALHAWAWWNLYEESVPEGQRLLAINMDETAIRFFVQHRGLCTRRARHGRDPVATQQVSRKDMRACLTHVAFACADAGVQRFLPHIFIGNEHVLRVSDVAALAPRCAANVTILRRQSAWVNTPLMVQIMHALGAALRACTEGMQLVLLMDAHHVHLAAPVLRAAASWGIWVLPLPAKTTWLLQPLDTHIFSAYKAAMRRKYVEVLACQDSPRMQPGSVLWAAHGACVEVLNGRDHAQAFLHNGFGKQQADLRRSLLRELGVDVVVPPRGALPTYTDLRAYLGLHGDICVAALFGAALSGQRPLRAPRARSASPEADSAVESAWEKRLRPRRSTSTLSLEEVGVSPSAAAASAPPAELPAPPPAWPAPRATRLPGPRGPRLVRPRRSLRVTEDTPQGLP